ncbi:MAG: FAD binding domain-containing protein [Phycisphaerae bacterium]
MIKEYHTPATIEEAVSIKGRFASLASFLAGGTQVNAKAFPRSPEHVISLERLALTDVRVTQTEWIIGACCTIQQLIEAADVPDCVRTAARHMINRNIRNMATIGGELAGNQSCGSLIPVLVALEATVDVAAGGATDTIPAGQYLTDEREDLITHVRIPKSDPPRSVAVEKHSLTANDPAIITAAVSLTKDGNVITAPIIAVGGVAKHVIRLQAVEEELQGKPLPARETIERSVADHVSPAADIRGSVEFKRYLAGVLVANTILGACQQEGW